MLSFEQLETRVFTLSFTCCSFFPIFPLAYTKPSGQYVRNASGRASEQASVWNENRVCERKEIKHSFAPNVSNDMHTQYLCCMSRIHTLSFSFLFCLNSTLLFSISLNVWNVRWQSVMLTLCSSECRYFQRSVFVAALWEFILSPLASR